MKKMTIIILGIILNLILLSTIVKADNSFSCIVTANKTTFNVVDINENLEIKIALDNINMGEEGLNVLEGIIKYDSNIFETLENIDIQGINDWNISYSNTTGKFLAVKLVDGIKEKEEICKIIFKIKGDVLSKNTEIIFTNISSNDGKAITTIEDQIIPLKFISDTGEINGLLPNTGNSKLILILIVVMCILIFVYYIKGRNKK